MPSGFISRAIWKMTFLQQAGAAVLLVLVTLFLQCGGAATLIIWIRSIPRESRRVRVFRCAALVMQTTVAVIVLHGIVILLWASCYRWLCLPSWESAFYFSASSYATVGYGDVVLPSKWRLLGPLESMVGMLMSGVSIGLLFAAVTHLVDGKPRPSPLLHAEPTNAGEIRVRQRRRCYSRGFRSDLSIP
jgi:voltage-gated potassium channel